MSLPKIHLYFVPGLAASIKIFDFLKFNATQYEAHFIPWLMPKSIHETLEEYAQRMAYFVKQENAVLIGVSFGGIMVQEMSKFLNPKKVIIISSVKNREELPNRLKIIQKTKAYKLLPSKAISNIEDFTAFSFGKKITKKMTLYNKYLSVRNEKYLNWAVYNVLHWNSQKETKNLIHIHGTKDPVFPIKHIKNCMKIENGTHIMILNKAKTISKIIQKLV